MINPTTRIYLQFIETLANRAKHSTDIKFRERLRIDILRYISRIMDMTSVYLCQHNFEERYSVVKAGFVVNTFYPGEAADDVGSIYPEPDQSDWSVWLRGAHHTPRILHAAELEEDHPEYEEYGGFDNLSALFAGVYHQGDLWGYVEGWDTRRQREYPLEEQALLEKVCQLISTTIVTEAG